MKCPREPKKSRLHLACFGRTAVPQPKIPNLQWDATGKSRKLSHLRSRNQQTPGILWLPLSPLSRILLHPDKASECNRSSVEKLCEERGGCRREGGGVVFCSGKHRDKHRAPSYWGGWLVEGRIPELGLDGRTRLSGERSWHSGSTVFVTVPGYVTWNQSRSCRDVSAPFFWNLKRVTQLEQVWVSYFSIKSSFPLISRFLRS